MSSTYAGKEPEDDAIALALAQALTQALGLAGAPPSAVVDAYLAMLRGGACAEVSGQPAALAQSLDPCLATAASDNDEAPLVLKPAQRSDHSLVYLRVVGRRREEIRGLRARIIRPTCGALEVR